MNAELREAIRLIPKAAGVGCFVLGVWVAGYGYGANRLGLVLPGIVLAWWGLWESTKTG